MKRKICSLITTWTILCTLTSCAPTPQPVESTPPETTQAAVEHAHEAGNGKQRKASCGIPSGCA